MNKSAKVWGITSEIFSNDSSSIHRIEIVKDQFCSKHLHEYKYNMFFVENGKILVHKWENNTKNTIVLNPKDSTVIEPNIYHQFEALEDSVVYEIYYNKLNNNDIVRDNNVK
jgi:quercetin dioxygenase-like cupin family protein